MKKTSVISGILLAILFAVTLILSNNGNAANQPNTYTITVSVIGCDDCKFMEYCIDGGPSTRVPPNQFTATYEDDGSQTHVICVKCCGSACQMQFNTGAAKLTVNMATGTGDCQCGKSKK